jgi:fibronectin-binding autotransporter adhesin
MVCLFSAPAFSQCTLNGSPNACTLTGPVTVNSYSAPNDTTTTANGTITNNGVMTFTSAANNTFLNMNAGTLLQGAGTVTLAQTGGGAPIFQESAGGVTLTNFNNLIQGAGTIGNSALTLANQSGGTISANSSGQTLFLNGSGGVTNGGLLQGTNSGVLELLSTTVANAGGNITANGGTVQIDNAIINGGTLNSINSGTLQTIVNGVATLNGVTLSSGSTYTAGNDSDLFVSGTITNNGNIQVNTAANNTIVGITTNTTLTGGGTLTLNQSAGGAPIIQQQSGSLTLENVNNTIQGAGTIGNGGLTLLNDAGGTISANASGQTLFLDGSGGVTNNGLLTATGGGTLELLSITVANAGANITANGGTVLIDNAIVNGGTLNSINGGTLQTSTDGVATLNGVTLSTGSTYTTGNDSDLFISGTLTNKGNIQVNAAANNTLFGITTNTTLTGGGTLTLAQGTSGGAPIIQQQSGSLTLENVNNLIQGAGTIGNGGLTLLNDAGGTINANASGQTLFLDGSGGVTNNGLLTATGGGTLELLSITVANAGANITANGGTVQIDNATINGGTLNSINGGTLQTVTDGVATLNGVTLSAGSTYTTGNDSDLFVSGTITNKGSIHVNAAANNTIFGINANTTLTGGGTVTLAQSGGGAPIIQQESGSLTLENVNNTIQGSGTIGNGGLTLLNDAGGTINANAPGQTLFLDGSGGVTNKGLLTATLGGTLEILSTTINNFGGNITGNGGTVVLNSGTIQGGTLNGTLQTVAGGTATLDGATHGVLTLSSGTTYTSGNNTDLFVTGSIANNGNIQVSAAANNTFLQLNNNTTLTGGGTVTLSQSGGGSAIIQQAEGGLTLNNNGNTIQGAGTIGNGGLTIVNGVGGTILANAASQTLTINGTGGLTNNGTLQVAAGSTMHVSSPFTNFSASTLTGGTYIVAATALNAGILKIDALGTTGGEIVTNASTITLNGPTAEIVDGSGLDALSRFLSNLAGGSFNVEGGQLFTTTPAGGQKFANAGSVFVGAGSSLTAVTAAGYSQTAGTTLNDGTLTAGLTDITGGFLEGVGVMAGNVTVDGGGTVAPGDPPGTLTIDGTYNMGGAGNLLIGLASTSLYDALAVNGAADFGGTLEFNLQDGFTLASGDAFFIASYNTRGGSHFGAINYNGLDLNGLTAQVLYDQGRGDNEVELLISGSSSSTPEPSTWFLFAGGLGALAAVQILRKRRAALPANGTVAIVTDPRR